LYIDSLKPEGQFKAASINNPAKDGR